jgi:hypothetical protein
MLRNARKEGLRTIADSLIKADQFVLQKDQYEILVHVFSSSFLPTGHGS